MKQRQKFRRYGYERHRSYGVCGVRPVQMTDFLAASIPLELPSFLVYYFYKTRHIPLTKRTMTVSAKDELDAYTEVSNKLRDKQVATHKQRKRKQNRAFKEMHKYQKMGGQWHYRMMQWIRIEYGQSIHI